EPPACRTADAFADEPDSLPVVEASRQAEAAPEANDARRLLDAKVAPSGGQRDAPGGRVARGRFQLPRPAQADAMRVHDTVRCIRRRTPRIQRRSWTNSAGASSASPTSITASCPASAARRMRNW